VTKASIKTIGTLAQQVAADAKKAATQAATAALDTAVKAEVNWTKIEADYRAGVKSMRLIADEHGITHGAINKRAKRDGWTRDLSEKIRAAADAKVSKAAVSSAGIQAKSPAQVVTENAVIEAEADIQFRIRMGHRQDIGRTRKLFSQLLGELELTTDNLDLFAQLGELLDESGPDERGNWRKDKLNEIYRAVVSTTGRIDGAKKLTEILEKVVRLEREAFGIDQTKSEKDSVETMLDKVKAKLGLS
jgi:hypothetical protein